MCFQHPTGEIAKEIIFEIAIRLPFEELIDKRLVSKQWSQTLKNNYFWYKKYCSDFDSLVNDHQQDWSSLYRNKYRSMGYHPDNFAYSAQAFENIVKTGNIALLKRFEAYKKKRPWLPDIRDDNEVKILKLAFRPQQENIRNYLIGAKPTIYNKLCCDAVINNDHNLVLNILQLIHQHVDSEMTNEIYFLIGKRGNRSLAQRIVNTLPLPLENINKIAYGAMQNKQWFFLSLFTCSHPIDYNIILKYAIGNSDCEMINYVLDKGANDVDQLGQFLNNFNLTADTKISYESQQFKAVASAETLNKFKTILFKTINLGFTELDPLIEKYSQISEFQPLVKILISNYWKYISVQIILTVIIKLKYHPPNFEEIIEEKKPTIIWHFLTFLIVHGYRQPGQSKTVTHTLADLKITLNYARKYSLIDYSQLDTLIKLATQEYQYDVLPILRNTK